MTTENEKQFEVIELVMTRGDWNTVDQVLYHLMNGAPISLANLSAREMSAIRRLRRVLAVIG